MLPDCLGFVFSQSFDSFLPMTLSFPRPSGCSFLSFNVRVHGTLSGPNTVGTAFSPFSFQASVIIELKNTHKETTEVEIWFWSGNTDSVVVPHLDMIGTSHEGLQRSAGG